MVYWFEAIGWVKREGRCWIRGDVSVLSLCNHNKEEILAKGEASSRAAFLLFLGTTLWRVEDISLFSGPAASPPPPHPHHSFSFPSPLRGCSFACCSAVSPFLFPPRSAESLPSFLRNALRNEGAEDSVESDACICIPHCQDQKLKRLTRNHHPPNTSPAPCPLPAEQLTISPAEHSPEAAPRHKPTKSIQLLASPLLCSYTALDSSGFFRVVNLRIATR